MANAGVRASLLSRKQTGSVSNCSITLLFQTFMKRRDTECEPGFHATLLTNDEVLTVLLIACLHEPLMENKSTSSQ